MQRVDEASVRVDGECVGAIGRGLLVFLGVGRDDGPDHVEAMADKIAGLRIFADEEGRMARSVTDVGGAVLVVPQFTLWGDVRRGRRPSFDGAAPPERAEPLYEQLVERLRARGLEVATGRFRAMMKVHGVGDGPVTILVDTDRVF